MRLPRRLVAVTTLLATSLGGLVGLTGVVAPPSAYAAVSGSDSGGDRYFPLDGNGGYQVEHYALRIGYDPDTDALTGRAVITAVAKADLSSFSLDLALTADTVRVRGDAARFRKPDPHELRVTPAATVREGDTFRTVVTYHGTPHTARAVGQTPFSWVAGEGVAVGQPQMGPWWFPANETPADKATFDVAVTVPTGDEAISNGRLVSQAPATDGGTTWTWHAAEPMTTYLAFFAAGDFEMKQETVGGLPAWYAVSKKLSPTSREAAFALLARTPEVISWLEDHFGDYPFDSTGGVVTAAGLDYLLENQTRPVIPYIGGDSPGNRSLVVHEQAHQWFGDDVAVRRWRDIWLNEGLATYAEWLWAEEHRGATVARQLQDAWSSHDASSSYWRLRISNPGPADMFDDAVYERGAMTIAALRNRIGMADLRVVLRRWVQEHEQGHGTGKQFRALAEQVSGVDLDAFFQHWLDDRERPAKTRANGLA